MFQLTDEEISALSRSQNVTLNKGQGIYMLMTILNGELAIKQRRALMRTFKQMKRWTIILYVVFSIFFVVFVTVVCLFLFFLHIVFLLFVAHKKDVRFLLLPPCLKLI